MYRHGLVLGKFLPLHNGHIGLIDYALSHTLTLTIAVSATAADPIGVETRMAWLSTLYNSTRCQVVDFTHQLPRDGDYRPDDTRQWCEALATRFNSIDVFVSSERYGDILAEFMQIDHLVYQVDRQTTPISGRQIRQHPRRYRQYLPAVVQRYYDIGEA